MKPEKSGTAPMWSTLASGYCHDPAAVLNNSITVPTKWKIRMTSASFGVSSRKARSEEHTSELQSLMRISYAVFCLKKKKPHICTTVTIRKVISQHYNDTSNCIHKTSDQ